MSALTLIRVPVLLLLPQVALLTAAGPPAQSARAFTVAQQEGSSKRIEKPLPPGYLNFIGPSSPLARKFIIGSTFGMPYIVGPVRAQDEEFHLLRGPFQQTFARDGAGWKFVSSKPLPRPPARTPAMPSGNPPHTDPQAEEPPFETLQVGRTLGRTGYQLGERGILFFIGSSSVFRRHADSWLRVFSFPQDVLQLGEENSPGPQCALLPGNRIALVGGKEAFLRVFELAEPPPPGTSAAADVPTVEEAKVVRSFGFDETGGKPEQWQTFLTMPFCVSGDQLFFYLNNRGRFFRLDLHSFSLTDLDTPWPALVDTPGRGGELPKWRNAQGADPKTPVLPKSVAFSPRPDGTVHARALMWNLDPAVIYSFELSSEGSRIKDHQIHLEDELPDPFVLPDRTGGLVPIQKFTQAGCDRGGTAEPKVNLPSAVPKSTPIAPNPQQAATPSREH